MLHVVTLSLEATFGSQHFIGLSFLWCSWDLKLISVFNFHRDVAWILAEHISDCAYEDEAQLKSSRGVGIWSWGPVPRGSGLFHRALNVTSNKKWDLCRCDLRQNILDYWIQWQVSFKEKREDNAMISVDVGIRGGLGSSEWAHLTSMQWCWLLISGFQTYEKMNACCFRLSTL